MAKIRLYPVVGGVAKRFDAQEHGNHLRFGDDRRKGQAASRDDEHPVYIDLIDSTTVPSITVYRSFLLDFVRESLTGNISVMYLNAPGAVHYHCLRVFRNRF